MSQCRTCLHKGPDDNPGCREYPTVNAYQMMKMKNCTKYIHPDTALQTTASLEDLTQPDQSIKQDAGKLDMGAVYQHFPRALEAAAKVREFSRIVKNRHNYTWEEVDIDRWRSSAERHFTDWNKIPVSDWLTYLELNQDEESSLPQHWHLLVSLMAIIELEERLKES